LLDFNQKFVSDYSVMDDKNWWYFLSNYWWNWL